MFIIVYEIISPLLQRPSVRAVVFASLRRVWEADGAGEGEGREVFVVIFLVAEFETGLGGLAVESGGLGLLVLCWGRWCLFFGD